MTKFNGHLYGGPRPLTRHRPLIPTLRVRGYVYTHLCSATLAGSEVYLYI